MARSRMWLPGALLGMLLLSPTVPVEAGEQESRPEAEMLLNLDLLQEADLAKQRDLFRRFRILERLRLLEGLPLLESQTPIAPVQTEGKQR